MTRHFVAATNRPANPESPQTGRFPGRFGVKPGDFLGDFGLKPGDFTFLQDIHLNV